MPKKAGKSAGKEDDTSTDVQIFTRIPRATRDGLKDLADADERGLAKYHRRLLIEHVKEKGSGK